MWICPKCRAEVDGTFAACWRCGTDADGAEDPGFVREDPARCCHVCDAVGAWELTDGVHVCPGCLAGTTPDPVRRPWYRRSRLLLGRFAGHPVHAEPFLLLLAFVAVLPAGGVWILAAMPLALLVHLGGCAIASRLAGRPADAPVTIALTGPCDPPDGWADVAGPLGNLLVAGAGLVAGRSAAATAITRANLTLGLGSLLPIVVMLILMRGPGGRGAARWHAARAARERLANAGRAGARETH